MVHTYVSDPVVVFLSIALNVVVLPIVLFQWTVVRHFRTETKHLKDVYRRTHDFLMSFVTQPMVDNRLRELAANYRSAANGQVKELSAFSDQAALIRAESQVKNAKEDFWKARNEAKFFGFKVQESFKDYLPSGSKTVA